MTKRFKMALVALGITAALLGSAAPAFAGSECLNPRGAHNGWVSCVCGCCERPRGQAIGWEECGCACCINPRGERNGWVACD